MSAVPTQYGHGSGVCQPLLPVGDTQCVARSFHFSKETEKLHFYIKSFHFKYEQPIQNSPHANILCLYNLRTACGKDLSVSRGGQAAGAGCWHRTVLSLGAQPELGSPSSMPTLPACFQASLGQLKQDSDKKADKISAWPLSPPWCTAS